MEIPAKNNEVSGLFSRSGCIQLIIAVNRVLIPALLVSAACAQTIPDKSQVGNLLPLLESQAEGLHCEVRTFAPVLDFSHRFLAGFSLRVPLAQLPGGNHQLGLLVRVQPEGGGEPVYLAAKVDVPGFAPSSENIVVGAGFVVGTGRYAARSMVYDESGQACHHEWAINVPGTRGGGHTDVPAHTVAPISPARATVAARAPRLNALTVLLDAAPLHPRMSRLTASDVITLTSALASVMEKLPARRVRLVVFNLDLQRELLREENFTVDGIQRVEDMLNGVQVASLDYHLLQNRGGHLALLADMVNRERRSPAPSDAVVFLSARVRYHDRVPVDWEQGPAGKPRFYSIQFGPIAASPSVYDPGLFYNSVSHDPGTGWDNIPPFPDQSDDESPDSIAVLVSHLKGRNFAVRTPKDFARVIDQVIRSIRRS
jgi:hypothetical protein